MNKKYKNRYKPAWNKGFESVTIRRNPNVGKRKVDTLPGDIGDRYFVTITRKKDGPGPERWMSHLNDLPKVLRRENFLRDVDKERTKRRLKEDRERLQKEIDRWKRK